MVPFLQPIFDTHALSLTEWFVVIGLALIPAVAEEITKAYLRGRDRQSAGSGYQSRLAHDLK